MNVDEQRLLAAVIHRHRWAALATLGPEGAESSWVAYAFEADFSAFYLHLSRLASHTRNLLRDGRACLGVSEQEQAGQDPQQLARVSLQGPVQSIERDTPAYERVGGLYRRRLPRAEPLFDFADFLLFRLSPQRIRFVGGFARAYTIGPETLAKAATREDGSR